VSKHRKTAGLRDTVLKMAFLNAFMAFIKERESEDMKIEEAFRVKQEDTEEQTKMVFIKERKIEGAFGVKQEGTGEQTGWFHSQS